MGAEEKKDIDATNFREAAKKAIDKYFERGMIIDGMVWGRIRQMYEQLVDTATDALRKINNGRHGPEALDTTRMALLAWGALRVIKGEEPSKEETWEEAFESAKKEIGHALEVIDNLAGWSGSSGNWPLQEASGRVAAAKKMLEQQPWGYSFIFTEPQIEEMKRVLMNAITDESSDGSSEENLKELRNLVELLARK